MNNGSWIITEDDTEALIANCTDLNTALAILDEIFNDLQWTMIGDTLVFWEGVHKREGKSYTGDITFIEYNNPAKGWF